MLITQYYVTKKHSVVLLSYKEKIGEIDEEIWFYNKEKVKINFENDDDFINDLIEKSQLIFARKKALNAIARRSYSVKELRQKLKRDFSDDAVDFAINRMEELGFLDDRKYAINLVNSLSENKCMSPKVIKYELVAKGVDRLLAEEVLEDFECDDFEKIRTIIDKKYLRQLQTEKGLKRAYNAVLRLGYRYEDAKTVITEILENLENN